MPQPRQAFFAPTAIPQSLPLEWRTPSSLPPEGSAVLNDTPVACQIRGPTRRETGAPISRRRQPPPTHCGASRRNGRDLIIATRPAHQPLPSLLSAAAAQEVQAIPRTDNVPVAPIPRSQHRQICTCPPRAKGSLDRRSKRLSFPHFFLRRKKCGRRRPPPRQGKIDSPRSGVKRPRPARSRRRGYFTLRRELLLSAVTKVAKIPA